jgi:hypothetical protein
MDFNAYLNRAWTDHGKDPEATAESLDSGLALCRSSDDVSSLVQLTSHLYSEHLRRFTEGERKLRDIGKSEFVKGTPAEFTVVRAIAAFRLCEGTLDPLQDRMGLTPGDLARALAIATSALAVRDSDRAEIYLQQALELATSLELTKSDGIARSLAVAGNNSAASLEELPTLTEKQKNLMLLAAETARKFWEIAGTWLEIERAEVRWALSCLKAELFEESRSHARRAIAICEANQAPDLEYFLAYEALARIEKTEATNAFPSAVLVAEDWFLKISPDENDWAQTLLNNLKAT